MNWVVTLGKINPKDPLIPTGKGLQIIVEVDATIHMIWKLGGQSLAFFIFRWESSKQVQLKTAYRRNKNLWIRISCS